MSDKSFVLFEDEFVLGSYSSAARAMAAATEYKGTTISMVWSIYKSLVTEHRSGDFTIREFKIDDSPYLWTSPWTNNINNLDNNCIHCN